MLTHEKPLVIFDGSCSLCCRSVRIILRNDKTRAIRFTAMQSPLGQRLLAELRLEARNPDSFVLIKDGRAYLRSDAALEIARDLRFPWNCASLLRLVPRRWRDAVYDPIARNRHRLLGKEDPRPLPAEDEKSRFLE